MIDDREQGALSSRHGLPLDRITDPGLSLWYNFPHLAYTNITDIT